MGKKNGMISGLVWSYAERFLAQGITLFVSIVLARLLTPEHYGTIAIVTVFISIGDALVVGGFGNALVQKKDATNTDFNSICWVSMIIAIVLYIVLFISAPWIAEFYSDDILTPVIRVMSIKFIFSAYNSIQQAYIQRKLQFKKFFFATLTGTLISAIVGIGMAFLGFGVWALAAQYLTNTIIDTVFLFFVIEWKPKLEISLHSIKELWGFGAKILASTMVYTIKDNIRSLIVGKEFSSSDLAYYNQGKKFPSLLITDIVESLGKVLFPVLSQKQETRDDIVLMMRKSIKTTSFLLVPAILGLLAIGNTFIVFLLTDKWKPAVPFLQIMCLVYLPRPMAMIFQKSLLAIGNSMANLVHEVVTSVATIFLLLIAAFMMRNVFLIAWSYVVVAWIGLAIFAFYINHEFHYTYKDMAMDYLPTLFLSALMAMGVYLVGYVPLPIGFRMIAQILFGAALYLTGAKILRFEGINYIERYIAQVRPRNKQ